MIKLSYFTNWIQPKIKKNNYKEKMKSCLHLINRKYTLEVDGINKDETGGRVEIVFANQLLHHLVRLRCHKVIYLPTGLLFVSWKIHLAYFRIELVEQQLTEWGQNLYNQIFKW